MLQITRGEDRDLVVSFPDGTDLTGCAVYFTVKPAKAVTDNDPSDANAVIKVVETSHSDPTNGVTTLHLSAADTGTALVGGYVYDVWLVDSAGNRKPYKNSNGQLPECVITPTATQDFS